jgi:uncharacterized phage protein (predicted DNA packaging)
MSKTYTLDDVKQFVRVDYSEDDSTLDLLAKAAVIFIKKSTGLQINLESMDELQYLAIQLLVSHWNDNRSPVGEVTDKVQFSLDSMFYIFKYCR